MTAGTVSITIDRKQHHVVPGLVHGATLLQVSGIGDGDQLLLEVAGEIDVPVAKDNFILVRGGEEFSIGDGSPEIEDNPCFRHPVRFSLNDSPIPADKAPRHAKLRGSEIKMLDPTSNPSDGLFADLPHLADEPIRDDQRIIIQKHDRFITTPCGNVGEGGVAIDHLVEMRSAYPGAKIQEDGSGCYLVVPDVALPDIWNASAVTILFLVPNGYPVAAMDMFWISPALRLKDGREPDGGNSYEQHLGQQWQRFSWHYTGQPGWQPGRSSYLTHMRFAMSRLNQAR